MRLAPSLALAAALSALFAGSAVAQESDADKDWSKVVIGTEGAYPPFNFLDAAGELKGFDVDIAKALCAQMKVECTFVTQDWDGMIPALQNGNFDAIVASMSITPEREEQIAFTSKYYQTPPAVAVPKDSEITEATDAALSGKAVGAQVSTTHAQAAAALFPDADIRQYPTAEEYKLDIENGRLDAVVDDVVVLDEWLKSDAGACCKLLSTLPADPAIYGKGIGIGLRKGDDKLKKMLDDAIVAIREDGTYDKIQKTYFDFDVYGETPAAQ
ncbi:lysine/arginine/ornithine ABC transporter substrate-binding protein [Jiella pacifica]|uniref:Transporter substrate-binding domain-containing protein n=1 Tax=Jiella pacifica TaxID=2696469 RepID=A0A6N9T7Q7_9HYPH|nr:lysine/arginine/ornithine ABC transporter substrate-binding protein [Jiella pacifica]NDW07447.1 transporter substrate-binding domain-containing protein [Jiella pacifica]